MCTILLLWDEIEITCAKYVKFNNYTETINENHYRIK